jgi:hypothetical protein
MLSLAISKHSFASSLKYIRRFPCVRLLQHARNLLGPGVDGLFHSKYFLHNVTANFYVRFIIVTISNIFSGRWTKSRNPLILRVIHHRQNPLDSSENSLHKV